MNETLLAILSCCIEKEINLDIAVLDYRCYMPATTIYNISSSNIIPLDKMLKKGTVKSFTFNGRCLSIYVGE